MKEYFVKVDVKDELPEKDGRYIVFIDKYISFEADYNERYSFHEEMTDCSGVTHFLKPVTIDEVEKERFKMPTDKQIIEIAMLMSVENNIVNKKELANILATCNFILDRLYENNDIMKPSSKE